MKTRTITIVGLNRDGGSIGLALKQSPLEVTIAGHDRDGKLAHEAEKAGAIDKAYRSLNKAAAVADILILTVPASELENTMRTVGHVVQEHALVLDLSGGKSAGMALAKNHLRQGHYVGGSLVHAAAGLHDGRLGLEAANADAFRNSIFCVMAGPGIEPKAIETAVNLGHVLGAAPFYMDGAEYDTLVQAVETVPALMAAAMFGAVQKSPGWRDILRFAGIPFAQSTQPLALGQDVVHIALENKEGTLRWLDALLEELRLVRRWVADGEVEILAALLQELDIERQTWLSKRSENSWIEVKTPDLKQPSFAQQMFGGLARGRDSEK